MMPPVAAHTTRPRIPLEDSPLIHTNNLHVSHNQATQLLFRLVSETSRLCKSALQVFDTVDGVLHVDSRLSLDVHSWL